MLIQAREEIVPRFDALEEREIQTLAEESGLRGFVHAVLRNGDGEISYESILKNLITQVGDQYYGERAANITTPPAQVVGMKLGTGVTAAAKTGAGGALVTYVTGSNALIASGFPTSALSGTSRRIAWKSSWAAGVATNAALAEAVIFNDANADATSAAAATISRVLLSPVINKAAADTLDLTWQHDLLGGP